MRGISTAVIGAAVVVVIVFLGGAFFFLTQQSSSTSGTSTSVTTTSSTTTSSTTTSSSVQGTPPPGARAAFDRHLSEIGTRNIPTVLTDYQDNAVVVWTGNTAGLGGVYNGVGNIRLLYSAALSTANQIALTPTTVQTFNNSATQVTVNATLALKGVSNVLGGFNGTVSSSIVYTYVNGGWKITQENWDYKVLNVSSSGGATTFPEWQKVGPPISSRRGPDWLHNFAWHFGGPGVAVLIYAFLATLAVTIVVKRPRKQSSQRRSPRRRADRHRVDAP